MPSSRFRLAARAAAIVWTAAIFLLCLWPGEDFPETDVPFADKWTHFILFGMFSLLWLLSLKAPGLKTVAIVVIAGAVLGWLVEWLQGMLPALHRSMDNYDAVADALGSALGGIGFLIARRSRSSSQ